MKAEIIFGGETFPMPITAVDFADEKTWRFFFFPHIHHRNFDFSLCCLDAMFEERFDVHCLLCEIRVVRGEYLLSVWRHSLFAAAVRRRVLEGESSCCFVSELRQRTWECESLSQSALNFDALYQRPFARNNVEISVTRRNNAYI